VNNVRVKTKFVFEERYFHYQLVAHLNGIFAPRGGNVNKPIFKSSNARGIACGRDVEASI